MNKLKSIIKFLLPSLVVCLMAIPVYASYVINPFTGKLDRTIMNEDATVGTVTTTEKFCFADDTCQSTAAISSSWTASTNYGETVYATNTPIWFQDNVYASTTMFAVSSTNFLINSNLNIDNEVFYNEENGWLAVGYNGGAAGVNGTTVTGNLVSWVDDGSSTQTEIGIGRAEDTSATIGATIYGARQRGTLSAGTVVQNGDNLLDIVAVGHDGTDYAISSRIDMEVDGEPGDNDMPGRIVFRTSADGGQAATERLRINSLGYVLPGANNAYDLGGFGNAFKDIYASSTVNAGNVIIPTVFTDMTDPTGFDARDAVLSFDDATYTFTITGSHIVYFNGQKYTMPTVSKQITDATGLYYIYYDANRAIQASTNAPGFAVPLIATVYWNTTIDKGLLGDERHGYKMPGAVHEYLHDTRGVAYQGSGLTLTADNTTFSLTAGNIDDEDVEHSLPATTTAMVLYKNGSAEFEWDGPQTAPYKTNAGTIQYNNGNALANVSLSKYVCYWFFASNATTTPTMVLMGQRESNTLADARNNCKYESLTLGTLPSNEMKLLYRVIYQNVAGTPTYVETQDLRSVSNLPAGTFTATDHGALTGLLDDDHTQYLLVDGTRAMTGTLTAPYVSSTVLSVVGNNIWLGDGSTTSTFTNTTWNLPADTAVTLGGGVNGINFDSNTLSIDADNNRVGIGTATPWYPLTVVGNMTATTGYFANLFASNLTKGSILFAGASGFLAQENVNLFWDDTNDEFGIGTNAPVAMLDVNNLFSVDSSGNISASGTLHSFGNATLDGTLTLDSKTIPPDFYPAFTYTTSTAWTGTTTIPLGTAFIAETWTGVQCFTDAGTVNVSFWDGTNRMDMLTASTTVGTNVLSTNNTFTAAEKRYVDIGTPATSPTKVSCTVKKNY